MEPEHFLEPQVNVVERVLNIDTKMGEEFHKLMNETHAAPSEESSASNTNPNNVV